MTECVRHETTTAVAQFLAGDSRRPRASVVLGARGVGKSAVIDSAHAQIVAEGTDRVMVIDDAHAVDATRMRAIRAALDSTAPMRLLVAAEQVDPGLDELLEARCEVRRFTLEPLTEDQSRAVLSTIGVRPWSLHAHQAVQRAGGSPRTLIAEADRSVDVGAAVAADTSLDADGWSRASARRLDLALRDDVAAHSQLISTCETVVAGSSDDDVSTAEAYAVLAETAYLQCELERAIQLAERGVAAAEHGSPVAMWAAAIAAVARAQCGERMAALSVHALANAAHRQGFATLEAALWRLAAIALNILGDTDASARAAARSAQIADARDNVMIGASARFVLAQMHTARREFSDALAYLEELEHVASAMQWNAMYLDVLNIRVPALLGAGRPHDAADAADRVLELVLDTSAPLAGVVGARVHAARAHAACGSYTLAEAVLDAPAAVRAVGERGGPEFWVALEAIRIHAVRDGGAEQAREWCDALAAFPEDGDGGALRAAHSEAAAWTAHVAGDAAAARTHAERARSEWFEAGCDNEVVLSDVLVAVEEDAVVELQADPAIFDVLTKREKEIARLVAAGMTNPEIATELVLSPRTVEHHVASILRKLELPSRRALVLGKVA